MWNLGSVINHNLSAWTRNHTSILFSSLFSRQSCRFEKKKHKNEKAKCNCTFRKSHFLHHFHIFPKTIITYHRYTTDFFWQGFTVSKQGSFISWNCYYFILLLHQSRTEKTELIFLLGVIYCCVCSHKGIDVLTDMKLYLLFSCNTKFIRCAEQCGGDALRPQVECIS